MTQKCDSWREPLVVETKVIWPEALVATHLSKDAKAKIVAALKADPAHAAHWKYVRLSTGFCREITVSSADVHRLLPAA